MFKTFLFQAIQFYQTVLFSISIVLLSKQFYFKQFSLAYKNISILAQVRSSALFNPSIGLYQVLLLWAIVNLRATAMKGYSAFPKASASLPSDCLDSYPEHSLVGGTPLQRSSRCIIQFQLTGQLDVFIFFILLEILNLSNIFFLSIYNCIIQWRL